MLNGNDHLASSSTPTVSPGKPSAHSTSLSGISTTNHTRSRSGGSVMAILSPRSSNYERLEGGMGPSRLGKQKWFTWKRFVIAAGVVIVLVVLFGPRQAKELPWPASPPPYNPAPQNGPESEPYVPPVIIEKPPSSPKPETHTTAPQKPTSFETDPDASKTVFCTTPADPSKPLVQYALMIDAGSTGSRIHAYKFNNCGSSTSYEYETFKMTRPGLSSFKDKAEDAAKSLDELMDEAVRVVPEALRRCTPVAVKATAGLRLLPGSQSDAILKAIEKRLEDVYPFKLHGIEIMEGKDEGVYAWITANYLLDSFKAGNTMAVLDLGGASTQIVFQPTFADAETQMVEGEHKYDLKFSGHKYELYQHSYLGYGLMRARAGVHKLVNFMSSLRTKPSKDGLVGNPCLAKGTERVVTVTDDATGTKTNVTMTGKDVGSFDACNRIIELVMAKDAICEVKPCSFDGVYQPTLLDTFPDGKVLLLSYFYDRVAPLVPADAPLTVSTFADLAKKVCPGKPTWKQYWGKNEELMAELEGRPEWCLDLTFMHGLLRLGYEFGDKREVKIGKQIDGTELGWALGATLAMVLGGELSCRV